VFGKFSVLLSHPIVEKPDKRSTLFNQLQCWLNQVSVWLGWGGIRVAGFSLNHISVIVEE